jgi:DNA-binding transcriptional regulator YiaG
VTSDEFARIRKRLGLTQPALAARVGVHPMTVSKWERGAQPIPEPVARLVMLLKPEHGKEGRKKQR